MIGAVRGTASQSEGKRNYPGRDNPVPYNTNPDKVKRNSIWRKEEKTRLWYHRKPVFGVQTEMFKISVERY